MTRPTIKICLFSYDKVTQGGACKSIMLLMEHLKKIGNGSIGITLVHTLLDLYGEDKYDLVITQQWAMKEIPNIKKKLNIPVIAFIRGFCQVDFVRGADLVVYNSNWLLAYDKPTLEKLGLKKTLVLYPTIDCSEYKAKETKAKEEADDVNRKYISFISRDDPMKNPDLFVSLATREPTRDFIFVGASEKRIKEFEENEDRPKNLTLVPYTDNIKTYFEQSKVLIFPSLTESYGRIAIEAAIYGVPTIASPLMAIREALSNNGLYLTYPPTLSNLSQELDHCLKEYDFYSNQCNDVIFNYLDKTRIQTEKFLVQIYDLILQNRNQQGQT